MDLVYDKASALAIGFGPDERASNIIHSLDRRAKSRILIKQVSAKVRLKPDATSAKATRPR